MTKQILLVLFIAGLPALASAETGSSTPVESSTQSLSVEEATAILVDSAQVAALSDEDLLDVVKTADPSQIISTAEAFLATHETYEFVVWKQERIKGNWPEKPERLLVRYRHEPQALFVRWLDGGPDAGQEALYDKTVDEERFKVRASGWRGVMTVNLSLDSSLARARTTHPITSLSFSTFLDYLSADMALIPEEERRNHVESLRIVERNGQRLVELVFVTPGPPKFYASKALFQFDPETWVPRFVEIFEADGTIRERFDFKSVNWAPVAEDAFDPDNPDYRL